jgi:ABC-2 type transport system ATP-binding protein
LFLIFQKIQYIWFMASSLINNDTVIRLDSLSRSFKNLKAVNGLSLEIRPNEILGLLGPNGAGKTTTIRMICGLLKPSSGEILIHGLPLRKAPDMRKKIGYAPQENVFWPKLSCLEQLIFSGRMYNLTSTQAITNSRNIILKLGLEEKSHALASTLSGGMKRRLSLALALVHDPEILILDEPEAGLDPQSRLLVREYIRGLSKSKTIILSTHNMDEADRLSDRIAIMDRGKLLMTDSPENLKRTIGKGDVLELETDLQTEEFISDLKIKLEARGLSLKLNEPGLLIFGLDLIGKIPEISRIIQQKDGKILKMILRENSLEDVFIHLTGRRLRS